MRMIGNRTPYVPGPDGEQRNEATVEARCDACSERSEQTSVQWLDLVAVRLCLDVAACSARYRGGVSPETYAAGLRGDILAVAP